jgi:exodeoxyribonuclease VII large subunit
VSETKVYSLRQVAQAIRRALEAATGGRTWLIRAEVVKANGTLGKGHVYLDLVDEAEGVRQAALRGVIWSAAGGRIAEELGEAAATLLAPGAKLVFTARVQFSEIHGLSLSIERIELQYMLGELERRKQATIASLKRVGALDWNRRIPVPFVPVRIALIGSPGTSGFRDFCTKLLHHPARYRILLTAFAATVQGATAPAEVRAALAAAEETTPDLIVIVRGGGSKLDLDAFNDEALCTAIARCTRPVWTGIGHESDTTVADLVAHTALRTPTDAADAVLRRFDAAAGELNAAALQLSGLARAALRTRMTNLDALAERLAESALRTLRTRKEALDHADRLIDAHRPERILARGFAIVRHDGIAVLDPTPLPPEALLSIQFHSTTATATLTQSKTPPQPKPQPKTKTPTKTQTQTQT